MEISRDVALGVLRRWQQSGTTVGLWFAARGGTAGSAMLAQVREVTSRLIVNNDSSSLRFALYKARFEQGPLTVLRGPRREDLTEIEGLRIWLESGHFLFICDAAGMERKWLQSVAKWLSYDRPGGLVQSQHQPQAYPTTGAAVRVAPVRQPIALRRGVHAA
jgi:hypothetical protein